MLVCQQRIQSQDRQSRQENLQVPEHHLHNICVSPAPGAAPWSTEFGHALRVPLPAALAPTRTMARTPYSHEQSQECQPSSGKPVLYQESVVSLQIQPQLGIGRTCSRYCTHRAATQTLLCPQLPKNCRQFKSKINRRHTGNLGVRLQERQSCREESITSHRCAFSAEHLTQLWALSPQILHISRMGASLLYARAVLKS